MTDRRTDRIAMAKTRYRQFLLSRVKTFYYEIAYSLCYCMYICALSVCDDDDDDDEDLILIL